ncbi:coatomer subunit delta KNAG_0D03000 [Huiozyma naganishii CBS 8797]|uniref:Coatomer subunit delta n=1 Tax=Huiozyma naganishii (strain ATCC MYA-139 / BCRC 22969 / CBS 8797 / KCTC 17520 / NBRC 10181 / NCYC 3082 / Yp74L-3) TaxID=1071383 RepID=J7S5W7_HUIN7|nr:hypothetical protein KNAG_0D03000 [Kazachstania naganishii CBS 8797]CCK70049.1 hypothetical protein KNAG_0D03000 [Kazachstania naganishii CBS 8797]
MVVLAASITTLGGKALLSRQFKDLSRDRVLELLSNFSNLALASSGTDHTYVEDEHVRFVYKPLDDYYIVLVTNRQSNIIRDLATLNLFAETVGVYVSGVPEDGVFDNAFEILSAFDEIVVMGHKEQLSQTQVNTYLAMESHEERIQEIIERNKELEATEERKRRAKEIARREQDRKSSAFGGPGGMDYPGAGGMGPGSRFNASSDPNVTNALNSYYSHASPAAQQSYLHQQAEAGPMVAAAPSMGNTSAPRSGMKLASTRRTPGGMDSQRISQQQQQQQQQERAVPAHIAALRAEPKPENNGILICIKETVRAQFTREGDIQSSELKGNLELRINNEQLAHSSIKLTPETPFQDRSYRFETHPNVDKQLFSQQGVIALRDQKKAFPHNDQSRGMLRWRKTANADDRSLAPLAVTTWVSPSDDVQGAFDVNIEFEINADAYQGTSLEDLYFCIPTFPPSGEITLRDESESQTSIVSIDDEQGIILKVDSIEQGTQGSINFVVEADSEDSLFPLSVSFKHTEMYNNAGKSLIGVAVDTVTEAQDAEAQLPFDVITSIRSDEYDVL